MSKQSFRGLALACCLLVGAGCGSDAGSTATGDGGAALPDGQPPTGDGTTPGKRARWTVLVFQLGDNNLEPFILEDLGEMMKVGSSDEVKIVVELDRTAGFSSDGIGKLGDWKGAKRLLVQKDDLVELDDLGETNTGDPKVLADFIAWGIARYPAERYALILEDHGSAWPGFGGDDDNDHDHLSLAELASAIESGLDRADVDRLDLLGFDACLMANYEVAATLAPFADYMLASEELEPGAGWDYTALAALRDDPSLDPIALGKRIADAFKADYEAQGELTYTLALFDLAGISKVTAALEGFVGVTEGSWQTSFGPLGVQAHRAEAYGRAADASRSSNLVDLLHLSGLTSAAHGGLSQAHKELEQAVQAMVLHRVNGALRPHAKGLSIYFPPRRALYDKGYDQLPEAKRWRELLLAYFDELDSDTTAPAWTNFDDELVIEQSGDGLRLSGTLDPSSDDVISARLTFGFYDEGDGSVAIYGDQQVSGYHGSSPQVATTFDFTAAKISAGGGGPSDFAFAIFDGDPAKQAQVTIPLAYGLPGKLDDYVEWQLTLNQGEIEGETYYLYTNTGPGPLSPEEGTLFAPLVLLGDEKQVDWGVSPTTFAASQQLDVSLASFKAEAKGETMVFFLAAEDLAGNSNELVGLYTVP